MKEVPKIIYLKISITNAHFGVSPKKIQFYHEYGNLEVNMNIKLNGEVNMNTKLILEVNMNTEQNVGPYNMAFLT